MGMGIKVNSKQWDNWVLQMQISALIWSAIVLIVTLVIWYWVTRIAVKDGIKDAIEEAGFAKSWRKTVNDSTRANNLTDLKADK
ncbi:MAG: hypothetical protein HC858_05880 [Brachymonas sp.]|nr:hypothetical protein [Brachymonas sp.]